MQVHPNQISPAENFGIFYFLRNPTDLTTYYIQAVIYDVFDGTVLNTVKLTQSPNNAHLYISTVQAPGDPSGRGRNIVAIASVYTDAGYTTKSSDYEEQEQYFLVKTGLPMVGSGGGVDYRVLREMMQEALKPVMTKLEAPEPPEYETEPADPTVPLQSIFGAIGALTREIGRVPKEQLDLSGISEQLTRLHGLVATIPEPEPVDLQPVMAGLVQLSAALKALDTRLTGIGAAQVAATTQAISGLLPGIQDSITKAIQSHEITIPLKGLNPQPKEPTPSPIDVRHLM